MPEEKRFCERCMARTVHDLLEEPDTIYTYKRRRRYRCRECGKMSYKRGFRPSAESVY